MNIVRQAGGIPFRLSGGHPVFLLITARATPGQWIFPKGHIEPGESSRNAALREVEEEAGIKGELLDYVGRLDFPSPEGRVQADYYLVRFNGKPESREERALQLVTYEQALNLLTHDDARRLLEKARPLIDRYAAPPPP